MLFQKISPYRETITSRDINYSVASHKTPSVKRLLEVTMREQLSPVQLSTEGKLDLQGTGSIND